MSYKICSNCIMDTTDPDITFDDDGICSHCRDVKPRLEKNKIERTQLPWLLHQIRKSGKKYDCIIGLSGGVDSSFALYNLIQHRLRPFTFSVDNGWNDPKADENIMRLVEGMKVPFFKYNINLDRFKELQGAFIASGTKNIEIPTDHILMAATYEMAKKEGIKYIISGGNLATESIMPPSWGYQARDLRFIKDVYRRHHNKELEGLPTMSLLSYIYHRFILGIKIVNLPDYYDYNREEAKKILAKEFGWKDYYDKHEESIFTKWFQNFYLMNKFNIDKRKAHYSSMILSGQMTRSEALEKLSEPVYYPQFGFENRTMKYPKRSYKDFKNSEFWWNLLTKTYANIKVGK